jgi:tryptophan synthase alpha chain
MTDRLQKLVARPGEGGPPLLMCAVVAGDPHVEATVEYLSTLADAGADMLELIVPFSDPTYHGAVIQRACERALREEVTWNHVRQIGEGFRQRNDDTALLASSYYNRILSLGHEPFADLLSEAGFDGTMVTDLPWNEATPLREALHKRDLSFVPFVAPTTPRDRLEMMDAESDSFFVWTGHAGGEVTLSRRDFEASMAEFRSVSDRPILSSMKISSGEEAAEVVEVTDGVLVGSAIVWLVEGRGADVGDRLGALAGELREHLDAPPKDHTST